jgi:hypothetical protein
MSVKMDNFQDKLDNNPSVKMDNFQDKLDNNPSVIKDFIDKLVDNTNDAVWDAALKLYPNGEDFEAFNNSSEYDVFWAHMVEKFIKKCRGWTNKEAFIEKVLSDRKHIYATVLGHGLYLETEQKLVYYMEGNLGICLGVSVDGKSSQTIPLTDENKKYCETFGLKC